MANIGGYRAVGSPAPDTGRYQHSACIYTETFAKGHILALCSNQSCPNKGANWVLQEITVTEYRHSSITGRNKVIAGVAPQSLARNRNLLGMS
jgi:hypothetical protein